MKKSFAKRISIIFILIMASAFTVIGIINFFGIIKYYSMKKQDLLVESFEYLNSTNEYVDAEEFVRWCSANSLIFALADTNMNYISSNVVNGRDLASQILGSIMDMEEENTEIITQTDKYQVTNFHDVIDNIDYIQLIGKLENNYYYIARYPIDSIKEAASISFQFYLMIAVLTVAVSAAVILVMANKLTKPVKELSELSKRMAKMDFTAKYTSGGTDEIGQLGAAFNIMLDQLEKTISELKNANVKLEKDIEEKIQIDEMRKEFLSNVSHDLKTPIALIQGYAEGLKAMAQDEESREYYCDVIMDEAQKMNRLVRQLLSLSHLESGQNKLEKSRFDLFELVSGVVTSVKILNDGRNVEVINEVKSPLYVLGDQFMCEEVFTNYLTNAFNHVDHNKKIRIYTEDESDRIVLKVFNTGEHIPEDETDKIWTKFYKVDKARTREYGGSGIGLSIVKAIADLHGQECRVENVSDGVEFSYTFEKA